MKMTGKVKWFNNKKGYGFITIDSKVFTIDNGVDVFVHYSEIESEKKFKGLNSGDEVAFDIKVGERGLGKAFNVRLIEK